MLLAWTIFLAITWETYFGFKNPPLKKLPNQNYDASFSLAIFGDCQGADNLFTSLRPTYFIFNNMVRLINKQEPLFTVILGDLVSSGRRYHYQRLHRQLSALETPVYLILGNHDLKYNGRKIFTHLFGAAYYAFAVDKNYFIFLDNANGQIDNEQFSWLEKQLAAHSQDYLYIFLHQPLFDPRPGENYAMQNKIQSVKIQELFKSFNVKAVFASHLHGYYSAVRDGVQYFITGGGGSTLTSKDDFYHFLWLNINNNQFTVDVIKVKPYPNLLLMLNWLISLFFFISLLLFTFAWPR